SAMRFQGLHHNTDYLGQARVSSPEYRVLVRQRIPGRQYRRRMSGPQSRRKMPRRKMSGPESRAARERPPLPGGGQCQVVRNQRSVTGDQESFLRLKTQDSRLQTLLPTQDSRLQTLLPTQDSRLKTPDSLWTPDSPPRREPKSKRRSSAMD